MSSFMWMRMLCRWVLRTPFRISNNKWSRHRIIMNEIIQYLSLLFAIALCHKSFKRNIIVRNMKFEIMVLFIFGCLSIDRSSTKTLITLKSKSFSLSFLVLGKWNTTVRWQLTIIVKSEQIIIFHSHDWMRGMIKWICKFSGAENQSLVFQFSFD